MMGEIDSPTEPLVCVPSSQAAYNPSITLCSLRRRTSMTLSMRLVVMVHTQAAQPNPPACPTH